jgi:hypothetical protein
MNLKHRITHNLINIPGWHTKRKIVVIESDDWGSIRMPSKAVYDKLLHEGYAVNQRPYERYDSLASQEDLSMLFEVLTQFRDKYGHHPVITANSVVANPDFDKIRASHFQEYHYELFTDTLKRYGNHSGSFFLWKEGIREGIFIPQFHGREHINVASWMKALQSGDKDVLHAFDYDMMGIFPKKNPSLGNEFMEALKFEDEHEFSGIKQILQEGTHLFEQMHGFKSSSFIAPCYIWHPEYEKTLSENGVKYIQGMIIQSVPMKTNVNKRYHYLGQRNNYGQRYLLRNCFFEPVEHPNLDSVDECLNRIALAFRWGKPATISSHRINYIGNIHPENRDRNLHALKKLLAQIIKKWPDVEFMSSDQLGDLILQ